MKHKNCDNFKQSRSYIATIISLRSLKTVPPVSYNLLNIAAYCIEIPHCYLVDKGVEMLPLVMRLREVILRGPSVASLHVLISLCPSS
jgi:hypothetical protein